MNQSNCSLSSSFLESSFESDSMVDNQGISTCDKDPLSETSDNWIDKIPYNKFPSLVMTKLKRGERPTPPERRQIVRIVVAELIENNPAPRKSHLENVARAIVTQYPRSFADCIGHSTIGEGHSSLLCQLIARVENSRRAVSINLKRSLEEDAYKNIRNSEKYGCFNFQPAYPEGKNRESLDTKKIFMIEEFKKSDHDTSDINLFMDITYASQRVDINKKLPISEIKKSWPFLFIRKYLFLHAEKLLGFSIETRFQEAVSVKLPEMLKFFRSVKPSKAFKDFDLGLHPEHLNYIPMLATYFEEESSTVFKIFEVNKSLLEVQDEAPVTPFIACIGYPYELDPVCTVFVERVPLESNIPLDDAIHTWFAAFFVFNLMYPVECSATTEFIQSWIISVLEYNLMQS